MDIVIVFATLLFGFAGLAALSAWAEQQKPGRALFGLGASLTMFVISHFGLEGGFSLVQVPRAFVEFASRVIN